MAHAGVDKTLLVASAWVGDMVMSHALVQLLAQRHPHIELHVVAPPATAPLASRMREVSATHVLDIAHGELGLARRWRLARHLRTEKFAAAYVLPNSWKSALLPWFAGVPRRIGWHGEMRVGLLTDRRHLQAAAYPLMIERFMALADAGGALPGQPYPLPTLAADQHNAKALVAKFCLGSVASTGQMETAVTVLCPGAEFGAAKKWPARHYAAVAAHWLNQNHQVWLLGSPRDVEDCEQIAGLTPGVVNMAGKTSLLDALDLLSLASQAVCNDSGLMHVACALGVPTVGVFGSTSPAFTPPLGSRAQVAELSLPCRPCFARECPLGHLDCLQKLQPEQVIARMGS